MEATELRPTILKPYKERVLKPMKGLGEPDEAVVGRPHVAGANTVDQQRVARTSRLASSPA